MRRLNSETGTVAREPKSILDELAGTLRQTSNNCYRGFGTHVPRCDPAHDPPTRVSLVAQTRPIFSR